ncbi:MAG: ABC transporter permease [Candidatus Cloacimonetes bacterium]|nr:ABC transporter permease [Candidatus Cloacimonadota bacterium]
MEYIIKLFKSGGSDIDAALKDLQLAGVLGWQDIRQRYRRSSLGPFWITISMGVLIGALGLVFGNLFATSMKEFLPFLTIGLILWMLITTAINEGCVGFTAAEAMIKQLPLPLFTHILRVLWRNIIIFLHNLVIFPLVLLVFWVPLKANALLAVPGMLLIVINLSWVALLLGVFCTRFRDVPQIVGNFLQVFFYLTPIIWLPQLLPKRASVLLLDANPFFHLIEIVRAPLLGMSPSALSWIVALVLALVGWSLTILFYGRFRSRIAYWL